MKPRELIVVGVITLLLLVSIAITVPIELARRDHSEVKKVGVTGGRAIRYFVVGDYGEYDKTAPGLQPVQMVAAAMANASHEFPIDFIATTGDNVYPNGMNEIFDWRQFEFMYSVFALPGLAGKPWFPVFGNHDCIDPTPMLDASDVYPMWNMPSAYYNLTIPLDNNATVAMIFLDGCTIACQATPNGQQAGFCTEYSFPPAAIQQQYAWLRGVLADASGADWVIVHIHMPPFSAGADHGDNEALKYYLYPILDEFGVDFLITGHEHLMEYFYVPPDSSYFPQANQTCEGPGTVYQFPQQESVTMLKGSGLQEIVMGSSGHALVPLCSNYATPMADLVFGTNETYGYAQVEVSSASVEVSFFGTQTESPLFTVKVVR